MCEVATTGGRNEMRPNRDLINSFMTSLAPFPSLRNAQDDASAPVATLTDFMSFSGLAQ
jgi:hypothetical protein